VWFSIFVCELTKFIQYQAQRVKDKHKAQRFNDKQKPHRLESDQEAKHVNDPALKI
jgi:hypothetical protein